VPADPTSALVALGRRLRAAGVPASPGRVHAAVQALGRLDPTQVSDVYWAGRLTMCASHDDIERYDRVFASAFADLPADAQQRLAPVLTVRRVEDTEDVAATNEGATPALAAASAAEVLRHRDIADLDDADQKLLQRVLATFTLSGEPRRSRRRGPASRGEIDRRRSVARLLRAGGEASAFARRQRRERPRRVVLLVDVSGSMSAYADALLRFAHAAASRRGRTSTEVFTLGTRLTRVTRELSSHDARTALAQVAAAVPDWQGGTRLGELLQEFLDRWGQRGMARSAVVVVLSDGWERGDVTLLGEQMARLHRLAHRVVWANPRAGRAGFAPVAAGMAAALPFVDDFVPGHSIAALEELAAVVVGAATRERSAHRGRYCYA
jgi:uncharacterized protein with von Willebrand factor type A (vWA) domain